MRTIKTKKKFGQHFLINENIASKIVNEVNSKKNILEIGPGDGILTKYLIEKELKNFYVSEIDTEVINFLRERFNKIKILEGDFLKLDLNKVFTSNLSIIGNLPYNISSQILFKIYNSNPSVTEFVVMLQKEVAERICSKSGNKKFGILSVLLQTFYDLRIVCDVEPNEFNPKPKVISTVIKGVKNRCYNIGIDLKFYKTIVKSCFQNRRKTLRNSLKKINLPHNLTSKSIFSKRAEQLDIKDYIWLSNQIKNIS
tara:strand:- start:220 stop:984 length:765 start_codon:yes stop_codon:yes gene_type:complete